MRIAFIGDTHGRVLHALAAIATLQRVSATRFDLIVQVGDFGFPFPERSDESSKRYLAVDPSEGDLGRLLTADGPLAEALVRVGELIGRPVHFVRGNHEDVAWLSGLPVDPSARTARADPFDLFRYVPDGTVLDLEGARIAFLGGVEELPGDAALDPAAVGSLMELRARTVDLLVTHEGPYGSSRGYRGDVLGSRLITKLLETLRPAFHVFGHAHSLIGPERLGETTYLGVDALVASAIWRPDARGLKPGCLAVLDTQTRALSHVVDDWLAAFPTPFDFDEWLRVSGVG
jgi:Icc-related predicted phosphoesterase